MGRYLTSCQHAVKLSLVLMYIMSEDWLVQGASCLPLAHPALNERKQKPCGEKNFPNEDKCVNLCMHVCVGTNLFCSKWMSPVGVLWAECTEKTLWRRLALSLWNYSSLPKTLSEAIELVIKLMSEKPRLKSLSLLHTCNHRYFQTCFLISKTGLVASNHWTNEIT